MKSAEVSRLAAEAKLCEAIFGRDNVEVVEAFGGHQVVVRSEAEERMYWEFVRAAEERRARESA